MRKRSRKPPKLSAAAGGGLRDVDIVGSRARGKGEANETRREMNAFSVSHARADNVDKSRCRQLIAPAVQGHQPVAPGREAMSTMSPCARETSEDANKRREEKNAFSAPRARADNVDKFGCLADDQARGIAPSAGRPAEGR